MGVRWLFRKREIAKYFLKKEPSELELAEEYKGIRNDKSFKAKKQRERFKELSAKNKKPIVNNVVIFVFILLLESCGGQQYKKNGERWEYPAGNLYPTIMKSVPRIGGPPRVAVELKPKFLKFDCTLQMILHITGVVLSLLVLRLRSLYSVKLEKYYG